MTAGDAVDLVTGGEDGGEAGAFAFGDNGGAISFLEIVFLLVVVKQDPMLVVDLDRWRDGLWACGVLGLAYCRRSAKDLFIGKMFFWARMPEIIPNN